MHVCFFCFFYLQGCKHEHLLLGAVDLLQQDGPARLFVQLGYSNCVVLEQNKSTTQHCTIGNKLPWCTFPRVRWTTASGVSLLDSGQRRRCTWSGATVCLRAGCPAPSGSGMSPTTCQSQQHPAHGMNTDGFVMWAVKDSGETIFSLPCIVDGFVHQWERLVQLGQLSRRQVRLALGYKRKVKEQTHKTLLSVSTHFAPVYNTNEHTPFSGWGLTCL